MLAACSKKSSSTEKLLALSLVSGALYVEYHMQNFIDEPTVNIHEILIRRDNRDQLCLPKRGIKCKSSNLK